MSKASNIHSKKIIYFDGVCNLCSRSVSFAWKYGKKADFYFSPLQSEFARNMLKHANGKDINYNSVIYQDGDNFSTRSDAILDILKEMGGAWKFLYFFKIIPKSWRDRTYEFIARNRYRWFGRQDNCMVPTQALRSHFLS